MSFLTPLFLLGALAIAGPFIFHLIRQTTRERTIFSSLMFLMPTPPRLSRRSRLEHLLLLALRCTVIVLLALAFARPFFKNADALSTTRNTSARTLVLVDTSASMRRAGLWQQALDQAGNLLRRAAPGDEVAIYTFDRQISPVVTFEQWRQTAAGDRAGLAAQRLKSLSPGWTATRTGQAIMSAAELLAEAGNRDVATRNTLALITDLQEGSHLDAVQGYEWPKNISVDVLSLNPKRTSNASLQLITEVGATGDKTKPGVRVRVANSPESKREQFKVGWAQTNGAGFLAPPLDAYVPAGQSRTFVLNPPIGSRIPSKIRLEGDDEDFDNNISVVAPEPAKLSILYVGSDSETDPKRQLYFLKHALLDTRYQQIALQIVRPNASVDPAALNTATLIVLTDPLGPDPAQELRSAVSAGKTLLFPLGSEKLGGTLGALLGIGSVSLREVQPRTYAMLSEVDYQHPLFAAFADPRFSDFTKIRFWRYRGLDAAQLPGARVLARFDSGDPAILEIPLGTGRLVVLAAGWHQEDGQLALSTKFVPMLYTLLEQSGAPPPPPLQYFAGDKVIVPSGASVTAPDGSVTQLRPGETNFSGTALPGVYLASAGTTQAKFAVNVDPAESRLTPLSPEELERLGAPVSLGAAKAGDRETARKIRLRNTELENQQKVWRWVIIGALIVLLTETLLAGRAARPVTAQRGAQ